MRSELDRELWSRIAVVFERAIEVPESERAELLSQLCGSDLTVRREVEEMLAADGNHAALMAERRLSGDGPRGISLDAALAEGSRVGPYRIVSMLGAGGMGDVYRAERADGAYRQTVALKVLRPGYRTAELVRRFRIEREALARLVHPGIATILDGGALDDGRPYIVLELVDGTPITRYCQERRLSLGDRLALFLKVVGTVQFAHGRLVVHRDIKPSNILVQPDGTPRLLDFGIAKLLDIDGAWSLAVETTPEARLLTPEYAAPEQLRGEAPGTATDVYALGVLLFEMLTGTKPFPAAGRTPAALERAILETPASPPSSAIKARPLARKVRGDLDRIVLMALRKEPDRRYLSAAQLGDDIERWLRGQPVLARPDTVGYRLTKFVARNRALVAGGAAVTLLLAGFAVTATVQARRIARERDRAEHERQAADDVLGILTGLFERGDPNKHPGGDTLRVTSLLDDAEREVERLDDPTRQVALWRAIGGMRAARGEYARSIELLRRAYDRRRAHSLPGDVEAARIQQQIGQVTLTYRGAAAARPILDSSFSALRDLLPEEHEDVRTALSVMLMATSDSLEARTLLDRLLALERRSPSRDPIALASRFDAQGAARFGERRFADAAMLFGASLSLLERELPPTHQYVRTERQNLALAWVGEGRLAQAESLQRLAVTLDDGVNTSAAARAMSREALALTLVRGGQPDSAEKYEREALALFRQGMAPGHWRIWSATRNLAFIAAARNEVARGLALLDSAIALAASGEGARTEIVREVAYLGAQRVPLLLRLGRLDEAARTVADAEQRLGASPSVSAEHRADVQRYAGTVELASGNPARAAERFRTAVALTDGAGPGRIPGINSCLLGVALAQLDRTAEAREPLGVPCSTYLADGTADPLLVRWIEKARSTSEYPRAVK